MQRRGLLNHAFLIHRKLLPMNQNGPRGCATRGDEVYAEHTARARKCAASAHFILQQKSVRHDGTERLLFIG